MSEGTQGSVAVMAYQRRTVEPGNGWATRMVALINSFPETQHVTKQPMGH